MAPPMSPILSKTYLVLATLLQVIDSLSNLSVRIPEFLQKGETADLTCSYNLGGDTLYSVKWYKGRHEFYRYMPHEQPQIKTFPVKGMKINITASDQTRVVIEDVQINFSGTYLCEVTVTPSYFALMQYANMTVIDFPSSGPSISSPRQQYQVGETAHLTCSAPKSKPPTLLAWYINGEPANDAYVRHLPASRHDGSHRLELSFPMTSNHFGGGGSGSDGRQKPNRVRLKCLASISDFYWKSAEITLLQERPKFASVMNGGGGEVGAVHQQQQQGSEEGSAVAAASDVLLATSSSASGTADAASTVRVLTLCAMLVTGHMLVTASGNWQQRSFAVSRQ